MKAILALYLLLGAAGITAWVINMLCIIRHAGDAVTGLFLFKLVGLVQPMQFITVWFG